jgi:hypothetical protein
VIVGRRGGKSDVDTRETIPSEIRAGIEANVLFDAVRRGDFGSAARAQERHTDPSRSPDAESQARAFFDLLLKPKDGDGHPVGCVEMRIFEAQFDRSGRVVRNAQYGKTLSGWFDDPDAFWSACQSLRGVSGYVTLNPANRALLARACNRLVVTNDATKDVDVLLIRFLYIDIDPRRPKGVSSTDAERAAALARRDEILADHADLAASSSWGCSGNGAWILVQLAGYPNDVAYRKLIADALESLRSRYNDKAVEIDEKPKNPSRVMCAVGTLKCKGDSIPERPHRRVTLDCPAGERPPFDLVEWLGRFPPPEEKQATAEENGRQRPREGKDTWTLTASSSVNSYARKALADELARLEAAAEGDRNNQLNTSAFNLGQFVGAKALDRSEVAAALAGTARGLGLGEREIAATIRSGLDAGCAKPRDLSGVGQPSSNGYTKHGSDCGPSANAGGEDEWPPLRLGPLPPVASFPEGILPDPVICLAREAARAVGCDVGMAAGPILTVAGGLIGRSASLLLGSNWFASACLFLANVALPGDGKSPCLEYATSPIGALDRELADEFEVEKQTYRDALEAYEQGKRSRAGGGSNPKPVLPIPRRVNIDDVTMEAVFRVLAANPRGLTMIRDELSALILGLNQYKGGGGNDRPNLLKVWSGKQILIDRVLNEFGEPIRIYHPHLCIAGNLPPGMLGEMVNRRGDDGFLDRWLYVYPDRRPKLKSSQRRPVSNEAIRGWTDVVRNLWNRPMDTSEAHPRPQVVSFSNNGKAEFNRLHDAHVDEVNASDFPDALRGAWSKLEEYAGRFCLILALLRHAADPTTDANKLPLVGPDVARDAWRLVDYFKSHHRRVRASLEGQGMGGAPEGARLVLNWVKNHPDQVSIPQSELTRTYPPSRYDRAMMEDGLLWLQQRNALRRTPKPDRPPRSPGRPSAPVWQIHPDLLGAQAIQENLEKLSGSPRPEPSRGDSPDSPELPDDEEVTWEA